MTPPKRRIALIGSINRDTIRTPDGLTTESYGGLLYSALSLAAIAGDASEIWPVCNVGEDVRGPVSGLLGGIPAIRLEGLRYVPDRNHHCFLEYDAEGRKRETLLGGVPPLTVERLSPFFDCDAICFNFITGFELSLETFRRVRPASRALLLMDFHSLSLGIDPDRRRYWRRPPDWEDWVSCADVVQMNEREACLLWGTDSMRDGDLDGFGSRVLGLGPRILIVTRGAGGSDTLVADSDRRVRVLRADANPPGKPVDETGCGDVFLMGFTAEYLRSGDVRAASVFANRAAGANCCLRGIEEIGRIRDYLAP